MATQKRGKLNRLAEPASTSRTPSLGSISQPVNTAFRVRTPGPKLHTLADLRQLSATVGKGLAIQAEAKTREKERDDRVAGAAWLEANPEHEKGLTTLAKAIEDGVLDPTTTEMFWQGSQSQRGINQANRLLDEDSPLTELTASLQSAEREQTPEEAFEANWSELLESLQDNPFALSSAMGQKERLKSKFVTPINNLFRENSVSAGVAAAHEEGMDFVSEDLTLADPKGLADLIGNQYRKGILGQNVQVSAQGAAINRIIFSHADRLVAEAREGTPEQQVIALEKAYELLQTAEDTAVWGSPAKGYSKVYRGGEHEATMDAKLLSIHNKIEIAEQKRGQDWQQIGKPGIKEIISTGLYGHIQGIWDTNPGYLSDISDALSKAKTEEDYIAIFGEDVWTDDMTKMVTGDWRGPGLIAKEFDHLLAEFQRNGVESVAITEVVEDYHRLVNAGKLGEARNLLDTKMAGLPAAERTNLEKDLATQADVNKWGSKPGLNKAETKTQAALAESLTNFGVRLVGKDRDTLDEMLEADQAARDQWLKQQLADNPDLEWTDQQLAAAYNADPETKRRAEEMAAFSAKAIERQRDGGAKLVEQARSGNYPAESLDSLVSDGKLTTNDRATIERLQVEGTNADNFRLGVLEKEVEVALRETFSNFGVATYGEDDAKARVPAALKVAKDAASEAFEAWLKKRIAADTPWKVDEARAWAKENAALFHRIGLDEFTKVVRTGKTTDPSTPGTTEVAEFDQERATSTSAFVAAARGDLVNQVSAQALYNAWWSNTETGPNGHPLRKASDEVVELLFPNKEALDLLDTALFDTDATDLLSKGAARLLNPEDTDWSKSQIRPEFRADPQGNPLAPGELMQHVWDPDAPVPANRRRKKIARGLLESDYLKSGPKANESGAWSIEMSTKGVPVEAYFAGPKGTTSLGTTVEGPWPAKVEALSLDPDSVAGFLSQLMSPEVISARNTGLDPSDPELSATAIESITNGDATIFFDPVGTLETSGVEVLGGIDGTSRGDLADDVPKEFLDQAVAPMGSNSWGGQRQIVLHGVTHRGKEWVDTEGINDFGWTEPRTGPSNHPLNTVGNGLEGYGAQVKRQMVGLLATGDRNNLRKVQLLTSVHPDGIPMSWVINGEAEIRQVVPGRAEVNASQVDADGRRYPTRWTGQYRNKDNGYSNVIDLEASAVTTYTIPYKNEADGKPLDFLNPNTTRNFGSFAEVEALTLNPLVYDDATSSFVPGSEPYQYLERYNIEVTASSTWAYLKSQAEMVSLIDPTSGPEEVSAFTQSFLFLRSK